MQKIFFYTRVDGFSHIKTISFDTPPKQVFPVTWTVIPVSVCRYFTLLSGKNSMSEGDYEMDWSIRFSVSCTARQAISFKAVFLQVRMRTHLSMRKNTLEFFHCLYGYRLFRLNLTSFLIRPIPFAAAHLLRYETKCQDYFVMVMEDATFYLDFPTLI